MKKIIAILILLALAGWGVYFFLNRTQVNTHCEDGFRFNPGIGACEPVDGTSDTATSTVDFAKIQIEIPQMNMFVSLQKDGDTTKYSATYTDPEIPTSKGFVSLDANDVVEYSSDLVLVPLLINGGGTGQFIYVGLFDTKANKHLSSAFIGDRIDLTKIETSGEKVKVNFKNRLDSESFAAEPTIPSQAVLEIRNQRLVEIVRLQNADYSDVEIKSALPLVSMGTLNFKGAIPGGWYFEAVAPFTVLDSSYNQIAIGNVQALSDWMTTQRVPFEINAANISYKGTGTLIIQSDNIRGDEEGERGIRKMIVPVTFK